MPRPSNTAQRRLQIVEALLAVMAERGYDGASIQAIGARAGLAPGLVHYHFKSKREILLEAVQQLAARAEARFRRFAAAAGVPRERLRAYLDAWLAKGEGASPAAVAAWVMVGAEAVREPEVKAAYQGALAAQQALLVDLLREVAAGALTARELRQLAGMVLAAIAGAFQLSVTAAEVMPRDYAARTLMALVERYVSAARP